MGERGMGEGVGAPLDEPPRWLGEPLGVEPGRRLYGGFEAEGQRYTLGELRGAGGGKEAGFGAGVLAGLTNSLALPRWGHPSSPMQAQLA